MPTQLALFVAFRYSRTLRALVRSAAAQLALDVLACVAQAHTASTKGVERALSALAAAPLQRSPVAAWLCGFVALHSGSVATEQLQLFDRERAWQWRPRAVLRDSDKLRWRAAFVSLYYVLRDPHRLFAVPLAARLAPHASSAALEGGGAARALLTCAVLAHFAWERASASAVAKSATQQRSIEQTRQKRGRQQRRK